MKEQDQEQQHCCKRMSDMLEEERLPLVHDVEIGIFVIQREGQPTQVLINFCPWCGQRLGDDAEPA